MKFYSKIAVIILMLYAGAVSSCKKKSKYPDEPEITFKSFEKFGADSAHLIISFTDGDGDIGLTQDEANQFNFFTKYYQKKNGVFIEKILTPPLNYRIPMLNSSKKSKSLEGDIVIKFSKPYYAPSSIKDTIKYEVYILDRAQHESNHVFSDEIIVP